MVSIVSLCTWFLSGSLTYEEECNKTIARARLTSPQTMLLVLPRHVPLHERALGVVRGHHRACAALLRWRAPQRTLGGVRAASALVSLLATVANGSGDGVGGGSADLGGVQARRRRLRTGCCVTPGPTRNRATVCA